MTDLPPPGGYPPPPPYTPGPPASSTPPPPSPGWWQASDGNWYPPEQQPGYEQAPYQQPAYGYGPTPYPVSASAGTNGLAIASLVLGILWLWWIGSVLAVIFGHVSLSQIKRTRQEGRGLAIAGLVLGYIGVATFILLVAIVSADPDGFE